jgi:hypothetical protein
MKELNPAVIGQDGLSGIDDDPRGEVVPELHWTPAHLVEGVQHDRHR